MDAPSKPESPAPPIAVQKAYELSLWIVPKAERIKRSLRHTLGDRLVVGSLEVLRHVLDAAYSVNKRAPLAAASREINLLRFQLRLAKDLKLISVDPMAMELRVSKNWAGWWEAGSSPPTRPPVVDARVEVIK